MTNIDTVFVTTVKNDKWDLLQIEKDLLTIILSLFIIM